MLEVHILIVVNGVYTPTYITGGGTTLNQLLIDRSTLTASPKMAQRDLDFHQVNSPLRGFHPLTQQKHVVFPSKSLDVSRENHRYKDYKDPNFSTLKAR